ncbi:MAG: PhnA protein [Candidatus Lambdaproteobacteria bacterium RIFOXYD2_FULL_56_26]|uniref:PhnA protein n=1 Tax=Candidatus Lambdaproteobacteria bacterium RIFOXYD2_FULL_56_26 TaxID=1817773 RepID=A0A1F6GVT4_9PROT|nr:MAG: PhnA protein [Candidatus Lambdaproteobacteria bacterium RIFOXYD2_FULL_56_26]OGH03263.1 MAG: PhnA protein [Candidatus Lambdaproteobacteria bacterium RIFOXYC1_FULL_56_13]
MTTKDCNGKELIDGDSVQATKDLKVKGSNITLKRGETIKKIRLTENPDEIECKIGKAQIVLKTEFFKKA